MPGDYLSSQLAGEFEERAGDVVWRIDWRGQELYVIVLLEFQSTCEQDMALRILAYVTLFYQRLLKERPLKEQQPSFIRLCRRSRWWSKIRGGRSSRPKPTRRPWSSWRT
jgi:predicted transposase YdaD